VNNDRCVPAVRAKNDFRSDVEGGSSVSRLIGICSRRGCIDDEVIRDINRLNTYLAQPGIVARAPLLSHRGSVCVAVLDPGANTEVCGTAACLGIKRDPDWSKPNDASPDGSYCLIRADNELFQLVTDPTGSRSIWYLLTDDYCIASTSQRAIVALTKAFHPNLDAATWMLTAGALGPGHSWDRRVRMVPPNSVVTLEQESWTLHTDHQPYEYEDKKEPDEIHEQRLRAALDEVFEEVSGYSGDWLIPLSGGTDSRAILLWLREPARFHYVTWGSDASFDNDASDTGVAGQLASHFGLDHHYVHLKDRISDPEVFFSKFLAAGEGRINDLSGYLEEFGFWEALHQKQCPGILRGDQVFGGYSPRNPSAARKSVGLVMMDDLPARYGSLSALFPAQRYPEHMNHRPDESLDTWRCRLLVGYRAPVVRAALNEIKCAYTDVVNPLQFRPIIDVVLRMPDRLRTNKHLFARVVTTRCPSIPFAKNAAIRSLKQILSDRMVGEFLMDEIAAISSDKYLPKQWLQEIRTLYESEYCNGNKKTFLTPVWSGLDRVRGKIDKRLGVTKLDASKLMLRTYLVVASGRMLDQDALQLQSGDRHTALIGTDRSGGDSAQAPVNSGFTDS